MSGYTYHLTCIAFPTQVEGRRKSDNAPYYFRARNGQWTLHIGAPSWRTNLLDWPDSEFDWTKNMAATGADFTYGQMSDQQVRVVLDKHLVGDDS